MNVTREEEATVADENAMPQSPPTSPTAIHFPLIFAPQVWYLFHSMLHRPHTPHTTYLMQIPIPLIFVFRVI